MLLFFLTAGTSSDCSEVNGLSADYFSGDYSSGDYSSGDNSSGDGGGNPWAITGGCGGGGVSIIGLIICIYKLYRKKTGEVSVMCIFLILNYKSFTVENQNPNSPVYLFVNFIFPYIEL